MSVLLPKKLDKSKILNQVVDSSFHFENGLQTSSPWKTNKNARRATVCPEVQKSQKNVKNARKSLPAKDKAPKIKLDGPLKRRKKSAKQIEKAEQEYAFFDSSQDEGENEKAKQVKLVVSEELSSGASGSKKSISTPAAVSKAKSRARQVERKTPSKKILHISDKNSPRPSSPTKRKKQREPESPLKKVKASLKKISHSNTPVKKAKNTPKKKKTPSKTVMVRKKTPAKQTPAKKTPAKKTPAKKTSAEKTPAKKTLSTKTVPAKKTPAAAKKPAKEFAIGSRKSTRLGK